MAQQNKLDSLWRVVNDPNASDLDKSQALYEWTVPQQLSMHADTLMKTAQLLLKMADRSQHAIVMSRAAGVAGIAYQKKGYSLDYVANLCQQAIQMSKEQNLYPNTLSITMISSLVIYYIKAKNDYKKSIEFLKEGELILNTPKANTIDKYLINNLLGVCYIETKQYSKAEHHLKKALLIIEGTSIFWGFKKAEVYNNIGEIKRYTQQYKRAEEWYRKAIAISKTHVSTPTIQANLIDVLFAQDKLEEAKQEIRQLQIMVQERGQRNYDQAKLKEWEGKLAIQKKQLSKGIEDCQVALKSAKAAQSKELERDACMCIVQAYKAMNKPEHALTYLERYVALNDSMLNEETYNKIAEIEARSKYQLEKAKEDAEHEQERLILSNKLKRTQLIAWGSGVIILLALFILYILRKANQEKERNNQALLQVNQQLDHYSKRLDQLLTGVSHDVLSKLNFVLSTGNFLVKNNRSASNLNLFYDKTMQTVQTAKGYCMNLLRMGWEEQDSAKTTNAQYAVQELLEETFKLELQDAQIEVGSVHLPTALSIPRAAFTQIMYNLINNAIKFKVEDKPGRIQIEYQETSDGHCIGVKDNGNGVPDALKKQIFEAGVSTDHELGTGKGLSTVLSIAQEYGGSIWVEDNDWGGATFWLKLPKSRLYVEETEED